LSFNNRCLDDLGAEPLHLAISRVTGSLYISSHAVEQVWKDLTAHCSHWKWRTLQDDSWQFRKISHGAPHRWQFVKMSSV